MTKIYTSNVCEWVADRFMREYNKKAAKNREICLIHLLPINTTQSQVDSWERNIWGRYIMKILILIKSVVQATSGAENIWLCESEEETVRLRSRRENWIKNVAAHQVAFQRAERSAGRKGYPVGCFFWLSEGSCSVSERVFIPDRTYFLVSKLPKPGRGGNLPRVQTDVYSWWHPCPRDWILYIDAKKYRNAKYGGLLCDQRWILFVPESTEGIEAGQMTAMNGEEKVGIVANGAGEHGENIA